MGKLKGLRRDTDRHGNERHYALDPNGGKVRLNIEGVEIGSPEYLKRYELARAGGLSPAPKRALPEGSLGALINAYLYDPSSPFHLLSKRTQYVYRLRALKLQREHGSQPSGGLTREIVERGRNARRATPEGANNRIRILRAIYAYGVTAGLVPTNPAAEVAFLRSKSGGWHTWTEEEVLQFEAFHPIGTMARLAFDLMLYTGARRSDVVRLGPQHVREGVLKFTQQKTGVVVELPVMDRLRRSIEATPSGELVFLLNQYRRPFSVEGFGNSVRRWCDAAGLPNCTAHGLRKVCGSRLAEIGASAHMIAAVLGHTSSRTAEVYTKGAQRAIMARAALLDLQKRLQ